MAYGSPVVDEYIKYEAIVQHDVSLVRFGITVVLYKEDGSIPTEAVRDQLFQAFLNKVDEIPNTTVLSAKKKGTFVTTVTSGV